ncbi:putative protein FAR1-RELATED SEQUENCE 10 [Tripterygium wilfordii]|uniref:putative protein FAR1-RELATED SEQUENCE 10 n=1 Tax=Tripterygium wilfordii TaxID=458696 RepID=UPI0018F8357D|nr:putative protein FAR1-RELATED SEQUENCE 10 [Tripterygium wilfordii]
MADKTPLVVNNEDDEKFFKIGMTFSCEDEAYKTYNMYAIQKGFGVRRGQKSYNRKNELRRCIFLCSCEGFSPYVPPHEQRKIERIDTRCGCKARVRFGIEGDVWTVIDLIAEHNHELIKEDQRHLIKSGKKMTETSSSVLQSMTNAGIRATKAYSYITNEAVGAKNVGFTLRDCQNFLQSQRMKMIAAGDAQNETTSSFIWLFESFLESMGNKAPKTIFTDQDQAMSNAIEKVFPNTRHRLCEWHIAKNATTNILSYMHSLNLRTSFSLSYYMVVKMKKSFKVLGIKWFNVGM